MVEWKRKNKLVFVASRPKLSVIANQSADWCGNPPVSGEMYRIVPERMEVAAIFGGNRYLVPFNRGIATPVCALVRNDSIFSNTNLFFRFHSTIPHAGCQETNCESFPKKRPVQVVQHPFFIG